MIHVGALSNSITLGKTLSTVESQKRYLLRFSLSIVPGPQDAMACRLAVRLDGVLVTSAAITRSDPSGPLNYVEHRADFTANRALPTLEFEFRCAFFQSGVTVQYLLDDVSVTTYDPPCSVSANPSSDSCGSKRGDFDKYYAEGDRASLEACALSCQRDGRCQAFGFSHTAYSRDCGHFQAPVEDIAPGDYFDLYSPSCFECVDCPADP